MQNRKLTGGECSIGSLIYFFYGKGGANQIALNNPNSIAWVFC